jgi:hypothetical protein
LLEALGNGKTANQQDGEQGRDGQWTTIPHDLGKHLTRRDLRRRPFIGFRASTFVLRGRWWAVVSVIDQVATRAEV